MFVIATEYWQTAGDMAGRVTSAVAQAETAQLALKFANTIKSIASDDVEEVYVMLGSVKQWWWIRDASTRQWKEVDEINEIGHLTSAV